MQHLYTDNPCVVTIFPRLTRSEPMLQETFAGPNSGTVVGRPGSYPNGHATGPSEQPELTGS